ncbi:SusC/RagA family TonB-linked outer membrane protein [Mucilaginibacter sp.]|uniref:SusC/RagA family TonB-linked outer membrane protein n=1 Tax=Mucilaginibacter sp. TaxID=1882438 RepID=UPI003569D26D
MKVDINVHQVQLKKALDVLQQKGKIRLLYSEEDLSLEKGVSLSVKNTPALDALQMLLKDTKLKYQVFEDGLVAIVALKTEAIVDLTIKGQVKDATGEVLTGVVIKVKGTNVATTTDALGNYTLRVPNKGTLVVSYIGYLTQEVEINDLTTINITLKTDVKSISEVVVTALGIKKEKKALGYSVSELKGAEFTEARSVNIANSLSGKVAGLNLTAPATGANGSTRITIRGNGSISGNNQPLIVVDGVPINNDNALLGSTVSISNGSYAGSDRGDGISSINPDEIESVSVLKGATAAALYGSRASNGAILFTTKSAKAGKAFGVEFNENAVVEDILYKGFKDYQYEYGSGTGGVKPTTIGQAKTGRFSWGGKLDGSDAMFYDGIMRPYVAQKDNLSKFYNMGSSFSSSFALSGATENIKYRFSYTRLDYKGVLPTNTLKRDNFALNLNGNVGKKLTFVLNTKYSDEKNHNRPRVNDSPGNAAFTLDALPTSLGIDVLRQSKYDANGYELAWSDNTFTTNPFYAVEDFKQDDKKRRLIGSFEPKYQFTDWLYLKGRFGIDHFNYDNKGIEPYGTAYEIRGAYAVNKRDFTETNMELLLGVNKGFAKDFNINALVAGNLMKQVTNAQDFGGTNAFNIPFFYDISNIDPTARTLSEAYIEKRINSVYGSAEISYKSFLYLNGTARNDWFSSLARGKNSLLYPSVGLSFVATDAFRMPDFIDYLKVRTSWAQSGGDTDPYNLSLYYQLNGAHLGSPTAIISSTQVPNSNLQPLTSTTYEAGIETRLFKNRLSVDLTFYNRKTTNDIVGATISSASGFNTALFNVGAISNKGIELLLGFSPVKKSNFSWDASINMGYNKSEVLSLYGDLTTLRVDQGRYGSAFIQQTIGLPYSQIVGFDYKRDASGNIVYDNAGLPLQGDLKNFGSGVSPYQVGITNTFRYKRINLSFLVDGKFGGYIYSGSNAFAYRFGLAKETLEGRDGGIVGKGVNQAGQPNTVAADAQAYWGNLYSKIATVNVFSSDFIKLRQVVLNYTFPNTMLRGTPIKDLSLGLVGRNLFTLMKRIPNIDPESTYNSSNAQGLEYAGAPVTRTIGLNLNVKF